MIKIIIGEFNRMNDYQKTNIISQYRMPQVFTYQQPKNIGRILSKVTKPVLPIRLLYVFEFLTSEENVVDKILFDNIIKTLEKYKEHRYIDILVTIPKLRGVKEIHSTIDVIYLHKTRYADFEHFVLKELTEYYPNVSPITLSTTAIFISKRLRYSYKNYTNYRSLILSQPTMSQDIVVNKIKMEKSVDLYATLYDILNFKKSGIKEYYRICDKYTPNWVHNTFIDILSKVIKNKIRYQHDELKLSAILNSPYLSQFKDIILYTKIFYVYKLLLKLKTSNYPIEEFYSERSDTIE